MTGCAHSDVVPVELSTGEVVAKLCTQCDARLAPWFGCLDCKTEDVFVFEQTEPLFSVRTSACPAHD